MPSIANVTVITLQTYSVTRLLGLAQRILHVAEYVDVIGPSSAMLGPVADGATIIAQTEPACWGPMITPELHSGHTVTRPVAVEGAAVGDSIAIKILGVRILSRAAASGTEVWREGSFVHDAFVSKKCPGCGAVNPESVISGIGPEAVICRTCHTPVNAFKPTCGYTLLFDQERSVGVTLPRAVAESVARQAHEFGSIPPKARAHPALIMALADMPSGILARVRPMVGQCGTTPARDIPSSHNAGDLAPLLLDAPHGHGMRREDLVMRTDSHMDVNEVREGTIVIAPVKIPGGGVVVGDVHAMQGDGEIAGHTTDVAAEVTLSVHLIKGLRIDGPLLLPRPEDLPPLSKMYSAEELARAGELASQLGFDLRDDVAPIQAVGSGPNINEAVANGLERMAALANMGLDETKNRVTLTGSIEIGRLPGVVHVTMLMPLARLEKLGLAGLTRQQYGIDTS